uniref:Uncharacterized protein n=1 Tax=Mesocestoides corti TaxID=53468 RepID=A0A5K3G1W8_MESCO
MGRRRRRERDEANASTSLPSPSPTPTTIATTTATARAATATITSGGPKEGRWSLRTQPQPAVAAFSVGLTRLTTKAVESTILAFQHFDHIYVL